MIKKKELHRVNWGSHSAWGDVRYKKALKENLKKSKGKANNHYNVTGTIGRAGLIGQTLAEKKDPANADVGNVLHPYSKPGKSRGRFVKR